MPTESEASGPEVSSETSARARRPALGGHFARGALESAAHILGSTSASVFAAGLVLPYFAAMGGPKSMDGREVFAISVMALAFSMLVGAGAMALRGLAHCAPHRLLQRATQGDQR